MFEASFLVALLLLVWFETDAFNEYCKLFKLTNFFYLDEFNATLKEGSTLSYPDFLREFYNSFFTRLISCPICLSVWLGGLCSLFVGLFSIGVITLLGLIIYKLVAKLISYA
jgi:hypothetical protein